MTANLTQINFVTGRTPTLIPLDLIGLDEVVQHLAQEQDLKKIIHQDQVQCHEYFKIITNML